MSVLRVGINGFGRIGRTAAKVLLERNGVELAAINDPADNATLAHLFKYDSVHGPFEGEVHGNEEGLRIDGKEVPLHHEKDPSGIPWKKDRVDLVIEASGLFLTHELAEGHLRAGADRVILSAPPKDQKVPMVAYGIDHDSLKGDEPIVSNASCTTNSAAPMIRLLDRVAGIKSGYITTVHSYTVDQRLHDAPHKDLRRARAAAESIVPTTTGAAKAITKIFPHLDLRMGGCGIRVPVPDGSLTDITCVVEEEVSPERIDSIFREAAANEMKGILRYNPDPIVSRDIIGDTHSCIYDAKLTSVIGGLVKLVGWYDNEIGYSNRLIDLAQKLQV